MRRALLLLSVLTACEGAGEEELRFRLDESWPQPPLLPAATGPRLVVTNSGDDTLSFVDPDGRTELARIPVGTLPLEIESPHHAAATPDGRFLFVGLSNTAPAGATGSGPHGSHGTGTADGYLLKLDAATGRQIAQTRVRRSPGDVRLQPGGERVWQSHYNLLEVAEVLRDDAPVEEMDSSVIVTDAATMERIAEVEICPTGHGIAFSPTGDIAYVSCSLSDELAVIDTGTFEVERIPVGPDPGTPPTARYEPYALAVAPNGEVWISATVVGRDENRGLRVFDPAARADLPDRAVATEGSPLFGSFTSDGSSFFVVTQRPDRLLEIDPAAGSIRRELDLGAAGCLNAHAAVLDPAEETLWVVCEGDHLGQPGQLLFVDALALEVRDQVELGLFPDDVVLLPGVGR